MAGYFKVDGRKITLREYWNLSRSWKAIIPWIGARLGAPMQFGNGFGLPESVREMEIPEGELSAEAKTRLQPLLDQCLQLGFHSPRYYRHESLRRDVCTQFVSMLHDSGQFTLRLMHSMASNVSPPIVNVLAVLLSELSDGTYFFTSDQPPKFNGPKGILNNRLIGADPLKLIQSHQEKVAQLALRTPPKLVKSQEALEEVWDRYEKLSLDFQLNRGVYVRMAEHEVQGQQKLTEAAQALTDTGVRHAEVLVELGQLQNKKTGWWNAILLLAVSMLLFVGAGTRQWSWDNLVILVPVLFVHELGHYLAMRAFKYRNLRMFFIPFFGAAVAGQHYNVPGWKKVIVSMMGPVPGIVLGVIIGGVGLVLHQPWLIKVALLALIVNGLNLLPVLPLDGGWVFHTLIFSRHHWLDAGFRVLAGIALLAAGSRFDDKIFLYLGIFTLIGVPTAYRLARITSSLRQRGLAAGSSDDQTIPQETAVAIIDELKKGAPKAHTNKTLAQQTLQIFETLNARPPGWLGTVSLFLMYVVSLGMAVVFAGVFVVGQAGGLADFSSAAAAQAQHPLVCGTSVLWRGGQSVVPTTIIAHFAENELAQEGFRGMTNRLPSSAAAKLFGDSVFLTLPSGDTGLRKQWFDELQGKTKTVFVDGSNAPARLSISCQFATDEAAKRVETELTEYFSANLTQTLIPPWQVGDLRTLEQRAAHQTARKSYLKALDARWARTRSAKMVELEKQFKKAQRQGDDAEVVTLKKQIEALTETLLKERLDALKTGSEGPVDGELIDLFRVWSGSIAGTNIDASRKLMNDMAGRMGQFAEVTRVVEAATDRYAARSGFASSKGRALHLSWVGFLQISEGAPALADWLCAKGAVEIKYDILAGTSTGADEKE